MSAPHNIVLFAGLGGPQNAAKLGYVQQLHADLATRGCQLHSYDLTRKLDASGDDLHPFPKLVASAEERVLPEYDEAARWRAQIKGQPAAEAREWILKYIAQSLAVLRKHDAKTCVLWNQFTAANHAVAAACAAAGIRVIYAHLGLLPGTVVFEEHGQMAESRVAQDPAAFCRLPVDRDQAEHAACYLARARAEQWTRKPQGDATVVAEALRPHVDAGRKIIFYAGQNDFASGMVPEDLPRARIHSPHYPTTEAALRALAAAAEEHDWVILFKPHPSMARAVDDPEGWTLDRVVTVPDANVFACIEAAAATATILSQVAYLALIQGKPAVLLGRMQLSGMGCAYELDTPTHLGDVVAEAVAQGIGEAQQVAFDAHVARLIAHYLSPLDTDYAALMDLPPTHGAAVLATCALRREHADLAARIDAMIAGCTFQENKYRHYMSRTSWRVVADHAFLLKHCTTVKSMLDIGAVPPLLAALMRDSVAEVSVTDPGAAAFAPYCDTRGIAWANADLIAGDDPYDGQVFDLVCFCEVLEHLTGDVPGALARVIARVAPGGLLYVTTPNLRSVSGLAALLWHGKGLASKWRENVHDQYARVQQGGGYYGHVREYTAAEVIALFEQLGLSHVASSYQTHPRAETTGRKLIRVTEQALPNWRLYGKYLFRKTGS